MHLCGQKPELDLQNTSESAGSSETCGTNPGPQTREEGVASDDTPSNVQRLCYKAKYPIREDLLKALNVHDKVATGFPAGQTHLKTRLEEIRLAVEDGASEIDVVINRTLVLTGQWEALYDEIRQFRKACGEAHLKTILATGELGSLTNVYKASMVAMMAGAAGTGLTFLRRTHVAFVEESLRADVEQGPLRAEKLGLFRPRALGERFVMGRRWDVESRMDIIRNPCGIARPCPLTANFQRVCLNLYLSDGSDFIKTSTGKESVNATFPVAIVMLRAIRDFFWKTGNKSSSGDKYIQKSRFYYRTHLSFSNGLRDIICEHQILAELRCFVVTFRDDWSVGFKPAGGIRSAKDSLAWLSLIKEELGDEWLKPELFRIGASTLLADIERQIYHHVTGRYAAYHDLPMS
ncbi:putative deoxyribose-phosphate aldolase [Camelus ferus]|nr:putative deoxyribose-phosphate aldolase [Camelus ferus]